jgi:DNA repair protein RecO (recombination protein O)
LLVDLYTKNYGRVRCVAKGFRKPNKKGISRPIFPYTEHQFSWQGRGELKTLIQADVSQAPVLLKGVCLFTGLYLNELFYRLLHEQDIHEYLYQQYQHFIAILCSGEPDEVQLRHLEMTLLEELGYGLVLDCDAQTGSPVDADRYYQYIPEQGLVLSINQRNLVQGSYSGGDLINISRGEFSQGSALRTAKQLLRSVIDFYLSGRILHSRELYRQHLMSQASS